MTIVSCPPSPSVQFVTIVVTADCNLRCRYCYLARTRNGHVDGPALRAALDYALRSARGAVRVGFTGGEPLLHFPVVRRAVEYVERTRDPACRVQYTITTNGLKLGPTQAAFIEKHHFEVNLSFDGVPAAQVLRGRDTFTDLDRLLDRLQSSCWTLYDRRLSVAITLTPATVPYLAGSVE